DRLAALRTAAVPHPSCPRQRPRRRRTGRNIHPPRLLRRLALRVFRGERAARHAGGGRRMIAMQYSIGLPADYDMAIIRRRIADKGHLMDDCPGLAFKAYLYAARDDAGLHAPDNLYAPFYLW